MKNKHRPDSGFTLIELVVVVAVVAILGTALLSLVSASGNIYRRIQDDYDVQNEARIALSYITIKVRQNDFTYYVTGNPDAINSVKMVDENGDEIKSSGGEIYSDNIRILSSDVLKTGMSDADIADDVIWRVSFDAETGTLNEYYYSNADDYTSNYETGTGNEYPNIAVGLDNVDFIYDPDEKLLSIKITYTVKDGETRSLEGKVYLRSE